MSPPFAAVETGDPGRRQIRGSSLLLLGRGISLPLSLCAQVLLVRYLAKADYGALAYGLAVVTFFDGLAGLGLETALSRFIPIYHERRDWGRFFGVIALTVTVILAMGAVIILAIWASPDLPAKLIREVGKSSSVLLVIAFLIPLEALDQALVALFASLANPRFILLRRSLIAPVLKLAVILIAIAGAKDVRFVALGYVISSAIGIVVLSLFFARYLHRAGLLHHWRSTRLEIPVREVLGFSIPLMATDMVSTLIPLTSTMVLGYFHGNASVASYRVILPLTGMIHVIMRSFNLLYTPHASRLFARDDPDGVGALYWHSASWLAVATFPLFAAIFLCAEPLTVRLYGERYASSAGVLQILAMAYYFHVALGMNGLTLRVLGKVRAVVATTAAAQLVGTAVAFLLIPGRAAMGAAIATAVAMCADTLLKQGLLMKANAAVGRGAGRQGFYGAIGAAVGIVLLTRWVLHPGLVASAGIVVGASLFLLTALWRRLRVYECFPELLRVRRAALKLFSRGSGGGAGDRPGSAGTPAVLRRIRVWIAALGAAFIVLTIAGSAWSAPLGFPGADRIPLVIGALVMVIAAAAVVCGLFLWPDTAVIAGVLLLYANIPVILGERIGSPMAVGIAIVTLIALAAFGRAVVHRDGPAIDLPFLGLIVFLGAGLLSTLFARDPAVAFGWLGTFTVEVVALYLLLLNAVRSARSLRRVFRALVFGAAVLALLGASQEVSGNYSQQFMGLAHRNLSLLNDDPNAATGMERPAGGVRLAQRGSGPIGEPNRWAQTLLFLLPLGLLGIRHEPSAGRKVTLAAASTLIAGGVFLTYSRGALVTIAGLAAGLAVLRVVRVRVLLAGGIGIAVAAACMAPNTVARLGTFGGIESLFGHQKSAKPADNAIRGRMTEMLAAGLVALDHPLVGVGPGHFTPYYSLEYMATPGIAFRDIDKTRRAHSLYLEMAAETGIIGLAAFLAVPVLLAVRLWKWHRRLRVSRPDLADLAAGCLLALMAYLGTGVFLHLSYQRYYGLLLGLCGCCVAVLDVETKALGGGVEEGRIVRGVFMPAPRPLDLEPLEAPGANRLAHL